MVVVCEKCGKRYDDVYRLTYCPHDSFQMNTVAHRSDGETKVVHTVEDLRRFMGEK